MGGGVRRRSAHRRAPQALRHRRRTRRGGRVPERRAGHRAGPRGHPDHRRRGAAGADRARHARVGRDARGRAGRRGGGGRRARAARRGAAHARRVAARAPLRLRPRRRGVGLAQPLRGQRDQVLRSRRARSSTTTRRPRSSALLDAAPPGPMGRVRELHGAPGDYLRELEARFADLDLVRPARAARLRQRRHPPRGARDLPPPRRRRGRAGRRARRAQHQPRLRLDPRRASRRAHGRPRHRLRLRRRRRPRAGGRPQRRGGGRRRADGAGRAPPARARAGCRATAWR